MQAITYTPYDGTSGLPPVLASRVFYDATPMIECVRYLTDFRGSECLMLVGLDWHSLPD